MERLLWCLLGNAITVALVVPVLLVVCRWLKHKPALEHALWAIVLVKLVAPPVVSWPWEVRSIVGSAAKVSPPAHVILTKADIEPNRNAISPSDAGELLSSTTSMENETSPLDAATLQSRISASEPKFELTPAILSLPPSSPATRPADASISASKRLLDQLQAMMPVIAWLWIAGCGVFALVQTRRIVRHWLVIRTGRPAAARLVNEINDAAKLLRLNPIPAYVVRGIASPFVWCVGWLRLVWPERLVGDADIARSRAVICHELAHVRRRDHWISWIELVAGVLCWWNPIFWLVRRRLNESAELACDALVMDCLPEHRRTYAEMLLELSSNRKLYAPAPVLAINAGAKKSFERRLSMILSDRVTGRLSWQGFLLAGLLIVVALPAWSMGQRPMPSEEAKESKEASLSEVLAQELAESASAEFAQEAVEKAEGDMSESIDLLVEAIAQIDSGEFDSKVVELLSKVKSDDEAIEGGSDDFEKLRELFQEDADKESIKSLIDKKIKENDWKSRKKLIDWLEAARAREAGEDDAEPSESDQRLKKIEHALERIMARLDAIERKGSATIPKGQTASALDTVLHTINGAFRLRVVRDLRDRHAEIKSAHLKTASPAFLKELNDKLEREIPENTGAFLSFADANGSNKWATKLYQRGVFDDSGRWMLEESPDKKEVVVRWITDTIELVTRVDAQTGKVTKQDRIGRDAKSYSPDDGKPNAPHSDVSEELLSSLLLSRNAGNDKQAKRIEQLLVQVEALLKTKADPKRGVQALIESGEVQLPPAAAKGGSKSDMLAYIETTGELKLAHIRADRLKQLHAAKAVSSEEFDDAIIKLETAERKAKMLTAMLEDAKARAASELDEAKEALDHAKKLQAKGFISKAETQKAQARLAEIEARLKQLEATLSNDAETSSEKKPDGKSSLNKNPGRIDADVNLDTTDSITVEIPALNPARSAKAEIHAADLGLTGVRDYFELVKKFNAGADLSPAEAEAVRKRGFLPKEESSAVQLALQALANQAAEKAKAEQDQAKTLKEMVDRARAELHAAQYDVEFFQKLSADGKGDPAEVERMKARHATAQARLKQLEASANKGAPIPDEKLFKDEEKRARTERDAILYDVKLFEKLLLAKGMGSEKELEYATARHAEAIEKLKLIEAMLKKGKEKRGDPDEQVK